MCGLLGFIGESSNHELSQKLITSLFVKTESRGIDASGFYCMGGFDTNIIYHHKKPIKSSIYVNQNEYDELWKKNLNLGIFHCRAASIGIGLPIINENNHPFVSSDLKKAVIHNGLIEKNEYDLLKTYYEVETNCDSEIILRILEQNKEIYDKLSLFFENTPNSAFAVAYTDNEIDQRNIYLFRNELRPLYIVDFTEELNQVFFFSTAEILLSSFADIGYRPKNLRIHEIQPYNLLHLNFKPEKKISIEQFFIQIDETQKKTEINYAKIKKNKSDWKNNIISNDIHSMDVIYDMCNKINENMLKVKSYLNQIDQSNMQQEKIQILFNYLKDATKRIENLSKTLIS
jgi:glucosamine 6-phosphate synthetase-like amidotransferase/phosphosugar isomerase protein